MWINMAKCVPLNLTLFYLSRNFWKPETPVFKTLRLGENIQYTLEFVLYNKKYVNFIFHIIEGLLKLHFSNLINGRFLK